MNYIEHIVEPERLLLSWQASTGPDRGRHIVAELRRNGDDADLVYMRDSAEYASAEAKGFREYLGFPTNKDHSGVLAAFMRRLPPRSRTDYDDFLKAIRIPPPGTSVSDFALLGYAGARLPGDDFYIIHPFDEAQPPLEFLLPVAGYRHYQDDVPYEAIEVGMPARFELEPDNEYDPDAVRVVIPDAAEQTTGYVYRGLLPQFRRWMLAGLEVHGTVERKNGIGNRPQIYLFVTVRAPEPDRYLADQTATAVP